MRHSEAIYSANSKLIPFPEIATPQLVAPRIFAQSFSQEMDGMDGPGIRYKQSHYKTVVPVQDYCPCTRQLSLYKTSDPVQDNNYPCTGLLSLY
jgi:hypothetical protein